MVELNRAGEELKRKEDFSRDNWLIKVILCFAFKSRHFFLNDLVEKVGFLLKRIS